MAIRLFSRPAPPPRRLGAPGAGKAAAAPRPSVAEQLFPVSWRGVHFPVVSLTTTIEQELVEHEYYGVDGADVEGTGLKVLVVRATIPFFNNIYPGKHEGWTAGRLYPETFREFLDAFEDKSTGRFAHPELGYRRFKPHTIEFTHDAKTRDGVEVQAAWKETRDLTEDQSLTANASHVNELKTAADDLDASNEDIRSLVADYLPPQFQETFASLANKIASYPDRLNTAVSLGANKPAQMLFNLKKIEHAVGRAGSALTWPMTDSIERMKEAVYSLPNAFGGGRPVLRYKTVKRMTLGSIRCAIGSGSIDDLIKLNPQFLSRPEVPAGSIVRYYAP